MFGRTFTLFRMFGFAVRIDLSWLVIAALVTWTLADVLFPSEYKGLSQGILWMMGVAGAVGLFLSIVVHEFCHSIVARAYGLPMKGITLFIFGGVAEMSDEPPNPKTEFLMAIAGPASSLVIAGIFWGLAALGGGYAWPLPLVGIFHYLSWLNLLLVVFNMIPGFPLDGGRVLRSALWAWSGDLRRATRAAAKVGEIFGFVLIGLGVLQFIMGHFIDGLWWFMIGMFIRHAAKQGYNQVVIRQALRGEPVSRFMNPNPVTVDPAATVADLVNNYIYRYHYKMFPVVADGNLVGCISTRQVRDVPPQRWDQTHVSEIITSCSAENTVSPDEDAMVALSMMNRTQASRLLVVDHGKLRGILSLKDLLQFLNLKMELEGPDEELPPPMRKAG